MRADRATTYSAVKLRLEFDDSFMDEGSPFMDYHTSKTFIESLSQFFGLKSQSNFVDDRRLQTKLHLKTIQFFLERQCLNVC